MKKNALNGLFIGVLLLISCGCTMLFGPDERAAVTVPDAYRNQNEGTGTADTDWWTAFHDEQLNGLIARALGDNLTIAQAAARLRQAEAAAVKAGAARFPTLTGSGEAGTAYRHTPATGTVTTDEFSLGLAADYEIDFWGRVASARRSALYDLEASRFDLQSAAMTVSAQTASAYFQWLYLQHRLAILEKQLETNRAMLSVIEKRFQASSADALDVLQQRRSVAEAEADIPPVKASLDAAYTELAILVGVSSQTDLNLRMKPLPGLPERPSAGLPAELLERRPDLQAEWALLAAADWDVSAARADRMPALTLSGSASYQDDSMDDLFDNWVKNLAAGLMLPLIDGGSRRAEVTRTRAAVDEQLAAYREAVINALGEVDNALSAERRQEEYVELLGRQLAAARAAAEEAYRRYTRGLESYFQALSEETTRQNLEVGLLAAEYELLADRVQLYRVLGGDWQHFLENEYSDVLQ